MSRDNDIIIVFVLFAFECIFRKIEKRKHIRCLAARFPKHVDNLRPGPARSGLPLTHSIERRGVGRERKGTLSHC